MSETSSNAIPAYLPLRNDLIGEEPYGAPQLDVPVCLNVNENPYAPEPAVVETIAQRVKEIAPTLNRYPDREHIELRKAFSTYLERESGVKLSVDQLWGANGSNEIMLQLFQAFGGPGRIALGCDPTYSMYPEYARDTFTTWKLAHRNADFTLDVDATIKAIEDVKPAMIVLTSPNNPTGTPLKPENLKRVLEAARTAEVAGAAEGVHPVVVVDEAYIEFRDPGTPTALELIDEAGSLATFVWQFEPENADRTAAEPVSTSPESLALSKALKKRGWKFVGPTTMYAFMQSMGVVNDHSAGCLTYEPVVLAREQFTRPELPRQR